MKTLWEYKEHFAKKWIDISENDIQEIINNIRSMWNLLFKKYKENLFTNTKTNGSK